MSGSHVHRRELLQSLGLVALTAGLAPPLLSRALPRAWAETAPEPIFKLAPIGYPYEALEPYIDTATMKVHHIGHQQAAVNNLNNLAVNVPELATKSPVEMFAFLPNVPEAHRTLVRNAVGGNWNHDFYWALMFPGGAKAPTGDLDAAIGSAFGSTEKLKEEINKAGIARYGSGWSWLVLNKDKKLAVMSTPNQDNPYEQGLTPILGVDVWEHAYYLKHQNKRADYLKDWWNVVNWDKVQANFAKAAG